jgi:hypothetical protein
MINRYRLSGVLLFISSILLFYCLWFEVKFTIEIMAMSWMLLALSRTLIIFPDLTGKKAEVKIGKEIKK